MASPIAQHDKTEGATKSVASASLEATSGLMQSFTPVQQICEHLCGFHFYSHDMTRQVEAHHYCSQLNEDFRQCLIYDSPDSKARLIGVEYIISQRLFDGLPEDEKKYWHSHVYEVKGGLLVMPMPSLTPSPVVSSMEKTVMQKLIVTYGKTWHLWQIDLGHKLPLGPPQLMMAFTGDNQVKHELIVNRDQTFNVDTSKKREERQTIEGVPHQKGIDIWEEGVDGKKGTSWQAKMDVVEFTKMPDA